MRRSPKNYAQVAVACAVAFVVLLAIAYGWDHARAVDDAAVHGFLGLYDTKVGAVALALVKLGNPPEVALIAIALAVLAYARGRPRDAVYVLALIGTTSVVGQLLKAVLAFPRPDVTGETIVLPEAFPSGHATASMSLAIALVVVMPRGARVLAAASGVLFALGVSFSMLVVGGHFASDIVGGFLLATGIGAAYLALLRLYDERHPERMGARETTQAVREAIDSAASIGMASVLAIAAAVIAGGGIAVLALRAGDVLDYVQQHTAAVYSGLVIVLAALALLGGLATLSSRRN